MSESKLYDDWKELQDRKFNLEDLNAHDFRKLNKIKNDRLRRSQEIAKIENQIRDMLGKEKVKRAELKC